MVDDEPPVPPNWRGSFCLCCMAHEGCTIGSKSDDKSYVAGTEEADGRSDIERGGDAISVADDGGGGGVGSSSVAKWACKYVNSACKFTTFQSKYQKQK